MKRHTRRHSFSLTRWLSLIVALSGVALTLTQIILQYLDQEGICFNDSCQVVEEHTKIDPLYFNLAGLGFFLLLTLVARSTPKTGRLATNLRQYLLLAGIAAEGVLFNFQQVVIGTYCSYCLLILALVVVLNLLAGSARHILRATTVFAAVLAAFAVLNFASSGPMQSLSAGTMAIKGQDDGSCTSYLIFSSTCTHCEATLEAIRTTDRTIHFNPIDQIDVLAMEDLTYLDHYQPQVNLQLLRALGIEEVPVLVTRSGDSMVITSGESAIIRLLTGPTAEQANGIEVQSTMSAPILEGQSSTDSCTVSEDCSDAPLVPGLP
jgi:uncharacterized membrane protein